ncbi:CxC2 domain-containing protein [Salix suchowensis]|nr:CxC2 domain-containing protein [Salix suchowensis]
MTVQLLQRGLFPSTVTNPQTAATFHLLDLFQMLSMEGQVSAFEFYKSITRLTDKTQLDPPRDRYAQFLRMSREWRHLLQLKRSARGHHPDGAEGTQPGELAVLCPACPQPGSIYQTKSTAMTVGGVLLEDTAYQAHVTSDETPIEKSSCVSHKAVNDADKRPAKGLVVNGVGTVECTRHDFKRPLSVGDLRYGERYILSQFVHLPVPVFLQLHTGVGRTDGEAPERGWDYLNPAANQTKEMGPGSRRELLEDLMGTGTGKRPLEWVRYGNTLLRRMKEAVPECSTHTENHRELEAQIEEATITEWRTMVEIWESDRSKPNPYMVETTALSQDAIRLRLSDLEAAALASGTLVMLHDEMTPSMHQLLVSLRGLGQHATDRQRLAVVNRANTLRTRITNFYDVQKLYCPAAFVLVSQANSTNEASSNVTEDVARLALCLPSSFKTASGCSTELREIEWQLRYAQAHDALNDIRAGLHLRVSVFRHKDRFDRGQRALTRAMGNISRVQARIDEATQRYRTAYAALQILSRFVQHDGIWPASLQSSSRKISEPWGSGDGQQRRPPYDILDLENSGCCGGGRDRRRSTQL